MLEVDVESEAESADKMSGQTLFDRQHNGFTGDLLPGNAVPFCTDARNSIVQMTPFMRTLVCALHPVNGSIGQLDYAVIPPDVATL